VFRDELVVDVCRSPAAWTLPSHASIFSSLPITRHGVRMPEDRVPENVPVLAAELARRGYRTLAVTGGGLVDARYGFDRGFETYVSSADPVSAAVGFDFFVRAALRTMAGLPPLPAPFAAALLAPVRNAGGRLALLPGRLHFAGGTVALEPVTTRGSHDILAQAGADAIFLVPNGTSLRAGESVLVYPAGTDTTL